ncbi:hypothetical protein L198_00304 [Cryptococcus wingfieldii CBS 7118]|uniref:Uncharacterized protein n=1 Tax=Cryptococcus wingfieldii CBS 7118 TaxID=1295528 RepID=A0A1E3K5X9_9TREE|nr:hypothetical protein L198_00304 [Cryptococcus wingfieldii CBS 7118]ODO08574.1 hypothetical protein L198_00304 [Cryptococcus wingfieldii CBS 7118]
MAISSRHIIRSALISSPLLFLLVFFLVKPSTPSTSEFPHTPGEPRTFDFESTEAKGWREGLRGGVSDWRDKWPSLGWGSGRETVEQMEVEQVEEDGWVDFDEGLHWTKYEGGVPGYQVFTNLYLSGASLTAITPSQAPSPLASDDAEETDRVQESPFPETKSIISSSKRGVTAGPDRWRIEGPEVGRMEFGKTGYRLGGLTFIFNDGPGPGIYLNTSNSRFRHFVAEAFLGAVRSLASTLPASASIPVPKRIWFPRCGATPSWRDDRGENVWFLSHAVPSASIEDSTGFADRNLAGVTMQLEKVVIIDRWAAHSITGDIAKWGKMNVLVPTVAAPGDIFQQYRDNAIQSFGVSKSKIGSRGLPVVVYLSHQKEPPRLRSEDHAGMITALKSLTSIAEVHIVKVGGMPKIRQVELLSRALVVIGSHSDDLVHVIWMPPSKGSTIIELFETGGFQRDFELMASSLNHNYVAVAGDRVVPEEEWKIAGPSNGERPKGEITINPEVVVRIVEDIVAASDETLVQLGRSRRSRN